MLMAESICAVDNTDSKYIYNPYGSTPTATIQALAGTYAISTYTTTNDTLEVKDEFVVSERIADFEDVLSNYDLFTSRINEMTAAVKDKIDSFVVNNLCEDGTGTYSTPSGGFTTAANINKIFSSLIAKVSGYSDSYKGMFIILENSDISGLIEAGATNGFNFADAVLNNGKVGNYMGVDVYVTRDSTFTDGSGGTTSWANSGHRVFGIKGVATYASPRGVRYAEKDPSDASVGYTQKEIVVWGYCGFKLWYTKLGLIVDITVTT